MPFKPGQSGNPGGRPKELNEVRDMARRHTVAAINTLVRLMREADKDSVRCAAACALLDRGYGKATQPISGDGGGPVEFVIRDLAKESGPVEVVQAGTEGVNRSNTGCS